jgi:Immunity protein 53
MMNNDLLSKLSRWFAAHCDGEREHQHGFSIETTDNPGWWVRVGLSRAELADRDFAILSENIDASGFPQGPRWLHCCLKDGRRRRNPPRTDHRDVSGLGRERIGYFNVLR